MSTTPTQFTLAPGIHRNVPAEQYHAIKAVSASFLKRFILETPAHAWAQLNGQVEADDAVMVKGTALHAALLEPEAFDSQYAIVPNIRRGTNEWKSLEFQHAGKTLLKAKDNDDVIGMRDNVWADELCRRLLLACDTREMTIIWTDQGTGLPCKARIDLYSSSLGVMLDVKTTTTMERFERNAWDLGYHIQLAWYSRALAAAGLAGKSIGIIAVEQSAPYLPNVYEPSREWFIHGHAEIEQHLPNVADCMKSGKWPGYRTQNKPTALEIPAWVKEA